MDTLTLEKAKSLIPADLLERLDNIESAYKQAGSNGKEKIAVFDLDNTLLVGDIGDALFLQLLKDEKNKPLTIDGKPIPFSWQEYQKLIAEKKKLEAYKKVITVMGGIPLDTVVDTTAKIMKMESPCLEFDGIEVPAPYPCPKMKALVKFLYSLDYNIHVISASNHYSVLYVAGTFFKVPEANITGMKPTVRDVPDHGSVLGNEITGPVTVGEGKARAYREFVSNDAPLLTAGDSPTDFEILDLTDPDGVCIWVGSDEKQFDGIKQSLKHPGTAYFLERAPFECQGRVVSE
ncbi:MAG: haloacid dehalogenase-like hydrolase [bacterium]|nr:haloacid dehalogenase-like hydrolase [bacterium]